VTLPSAGGTAIGGLAMLSDAQLVLGLSRHLAAYQMTPERAALEQLELAGQVFDLAFRLRGSTTSSAERLRAIALDAGIGGLALKAVVATMESLGWIEVDRDQGGSPVVVREAMPVADVLVAAAPAVLDLCLATPGERASLVLLRETTLRPLLRDDALELASQAPGINALGEVHAEDALRYLTHTGLLRSVITPADQREVLYNPNIWTQGDTIANAALKAADARGTEEVRALLEEVADNPGMPQAHVKSTEPKWVAFAISQGLVQRSVIQTSDNVEQGFLFTPHLARDPFGGTAGDASGQVRQLVGSMVYASTFARTRLDSPEAFIRALISRGVAGNASSIGTDYPMLERAGIVRVVHGSGQNRWRLELLQTEVAEDALRLMRSRAGATGGRPADAEVLQAQRSYVHVDQDRARLALTTQVDEVEQARLLAALREVPIRRAIGGGR
jgi:hypothetical protein